MNDQPENWQICISKDDFEKIRTDCRFAPLVLLARMLNGIYFCHQSLLDYENDKTPAGERQRFSALLFACGVLYESLKVANTLGKYFEGRDSFKKGFGRLLGDRATKELHENIINKMRQNVVFHYNEGAVRSVLQMDSFCLAAYRFCTACGSVRSEHYFQLADEIALNYIIGERATHEEEMRTLAKIFADISALLMEFAECAEALIFDELNEMGWVVGELEKDS